MTLVCPKTHFDAMLTHYPKWIATIRDAASKLPDSNTSLVGEEVSDQLYLDGLREHVADIYRDHFKSIGHHHTEGLTYDDALRASPENVQGIVEQRLFEIIPMLNYEKHGRKTFFFGDNLTEKLSETDVNVSSELLTTPFPACMFVFDNQIARDALHDIFEVTSPKSGTVTVYLMSFSTPEGTPAISADIYLNNGLDTLGVVARRQLALTPGSKVEDVLATDWSKIDGGRRLNSEPLSNAKMEIMGDKHFTEKGKRMMRIIANATLYLASSNPDIVPGLREAPLINGRQPYIFEKRIHERKMTSVDFINVGASVPAYTIPTDEEGRKLTQRFKVRGHWKSQPHGPGRSLTKEILIEPYWKGPDAAEIIHKPYKVR